MAPPILNTVTKGDIVEHKVALRFLEDGYSVYKPISHNSRSDLVVEKSGKLERVQIKHAGIRNGVLICYCCSSVYDSTAGCKRKPVRYTQDEVDVLIFYSSELNKYFKIKIEQVNGDRLSLRVEPSRNNQTKGILLAKDFEW
jgi:hypothetical protein